MIQVYTSLSVLLYLQFFLYVLYYLLLFLKWSSITITLQDFWERFDAVFDWFKVFGLDLKLFKGFGTGFVALETILGYFKA